MQTYTPQEWFSLAKNIYNLALIELQGSKDPQEKCELYIKLVYIVNYFRLLRGEAFHQIRPPGMGELQQELYRMEDDLLEKLAQIRQEINPADPTTKYHLDLAKQEFDLA